MKKVVILCVLTALSATVTAQTDTVAGYKSIFGQEYTEWNGAATGFNINPQNGVLRTANDTVINDTIYKKVEYYKIDMPEATETRLPGNDLLLREDTTSGKVWCRQIDGLGEFLIADMSLAIGDTITMRCYVEDTDVQTYVVFDTMNIMGNHALVLAKNSHAFDVYCTMLGLEGLYGLMFIEGVGSTALFGYPYTHNEYPYNWLVCCHKDGDIVYRANTSASDCYDHSTIGHIDNSSEVSDVAVSPNPCSGWISIRGDNIQSASLWDIKGNLVVSDLVVNGQADLSAIPNGVYFLRVVKDSTVYCKTIIKR